MKISQRFTATDTIVDLVKEDYNILPILSRFSIPLGVGNDTIGEVCARRGISTDVFLLIVNYLLSGEIDGRLLINVKATSVVNFLQRSHNYFLNYKFPHIRRNLTTALDPCQSEINPIIINFFDNLMGHVREHFSYEEQNLFPYVYALADGRHTDYRIATFTRQHDDEIAHTLNELKNIILRYYATEQPDRMYDVLVDIYNVEEDLESHNKIENSILVPLVREEERHCRG